MSPLARPARLAHAALLVGLIAPAAASASTGLRLDPAHPPRLIDADTALFPAAGAPVELDLLPAVVVHTTDTIAPHPGARSLGGRSWLIAVDTPTHAITLALDLQASSGVDVAFPDIARPARTMGGDPNREGQWYLDTIEMDALHAVSMGDPSVRVAVIDSGIDHQHPDLVDRVDDPYDAFSDDDDPSPDPGEYCAGSASGICDEHGTAVAGVIAATADNEVGIRGMCPECTLIPIKMLGEGSGSLSADVAAFEHAIASDAAVINNSWGFTRRTEVPAPLAAVIARALTEPRDGKGSVVVFAAGNDNRAIGDEELQALPGILCVSAIDNYGYATSYTNYGPSVDIAAPSATVSITPIADFTTDFGGTSAAAPVVAGLAAWILSVEPDLTAEAVADLIVSTATESPYVTHGDDGHHDVFGYGVITPVAVLDALTMDQAGEDTAAPADPEPTTEAGDGSADKGGCSVADHRGPWTGLLASLLVLAGRRRKPAHLQTVR